MTSSQYICPACRRPLCFRDLTLECKACDRHYPVDNGIADFAAGAYYDGFQEGHSLSDVALQGLTDEITGTRTRISTFYLPRLQDLQRGKGLNSLTVLDCGCGNGLSVDLLTEAGFSAWGNDLSLLRKWQWRERASRARLFVCDGATLPFPSGFFDAIIAAGVVEHIGVAELGGPPYSVTVLPNRDTARRAFLAELVRVLSPGGRLWLDFPNGAFPIDFWHGGSPNGLRFHSPSEGFLPTIRDVRRYLAELPPDVQLNVISPAGRLAFQRVRRHWYGRLLAGPVEALFRIAKAPLLRWITASPLNPYLVLELSRSPMS
jgi:SAM-dependent methyltransferase